MWQLLLLTKNELLQYQKMNNKNPFEVRLDVLKMAQEMLDREMFLKEQKFNQQVETLRTTDIGGVNNFVEQNSPTMYTPEEVITRASALYNFVSSSTRKGEGS
jgi:3-dehydroquinate dehydratase